MPLRRIGSVLTLVAGVLAIIPCAVADPMTLEGLRTEIRRQEQSLTNVRVVSHVRSDMWDAATKQWVLTSEAQAKSVVLGTPGSKCKIEIDKLVRRWMGGPEPYTQEKLVISFDGKTGMTWYAGEGTATHPGQPHNGLLTGQRPDLIDGLGGFATGWRFSLQGFWDDQAKRMSDIFEDRKVKFDINHADFEGVGCVVLIARTGGLEMKWFFAPGRAYAMAGFEETHKGVPQRRIVVERWAEAAPGLFYPAKALYEVSSHGQPFERTQYEASEVVANEPLPEDAFRIKWPRGTPVQDAVANVVFVVGADNPTLERSIDEQVRLALTTRPSQPSTMSTTRPAVGKIKRGLDSYSISIKRFDR